MIFRPLLGNLKVPPIAGDQENVLDNVKLATSAFQAGFCRSALCVFDTDLSQNQDLDAHFFEKAKDQTRVIGELMLELAGILQYLRDTPFSNTQSMLDVTTVLITSEFSRTMRQSNFASSGTDHNALTNSALIGGNIIGASDMASVAEFNAGPGKAHTILDPSKMKIMGRPFDMTTQRAVETKPEEFKLQNYLTAGSLVNTVYSLFNVPQTEWRDFGRSTSYAGVLTSILK